MNSQVLLGIDYGTSKTGVALGRNDLVMPLKIINSKNELSAIHEIIRLALENKASKIIMGLPITADGRETLQAKKVRKFAKLLKTMSKKPVIFSNEYGTTNDAVKEGRNKKLLSGNKSEDSLAAALILRRYYNEI